MGILTFPALSGLWLRRGSHQHGISLPALLLLFPVQSPPRLEVVGRAAAALLGN